MATTLRQLLILRAARLQDRPALSEAAWGTLSWSAWRNRVEGVALGLLAGPLPTGTRISAPGQGPWTWAAEVAAACAGLVWVGDGRPVSPSVLGGVGFNAEEGRGPYHDREKEVLPETLFAEALSHEAMLIRLQAWNRRLGWDHATEVLLPLNQSETPEGRAALWCALYAGAHTRFAAPPAPAKSRWPWKGAPSAPTLSLEPFQGFWSE